MVLRQHQGRNSVTNMGDTPSNQGELLTKYFCRISSNTIESSLQPIDLCFSMACSRDTSKVKGPGQNKRFWTEEEDTKLIESLLEMHNEGTFKAEGNFKPGYLKALEKALATKIPGCDLQARPHIESRMKTLKTHFQIVHEMLTGPNCSGFGWDPQKQMVTAEKPVWEAYLQS
ncbi:hypothetical protein G4B88_004415 [Cannabis sativa]|uniref:Myb/SANT-like domain-containing protein n=1 Tax=Cannabis sativa TaxID=3483 RepID=A0A7J6HZZ7_CANSA|nr:hypothetical protein G4B88_004415 [Cannabis sativa]